MGARKKDSSAINRKKGQTEDEAVLQRVAANHRERQRTKVSVHAQLIAY